MTSAVKEYLKALNERQYRNRRVAGGIDISDKVGAYSLFDCEVVAVRVEEMLSNEKPLLLPNDRFGFFRYQKRLPVYTLADGQVSTEQFPGNVTPNYAAMMKKGFVQTVADIQANMTGADEQQVRFYRVLLRLLDAITDFCARYQKAAEEAGCTELANALKKIPANPAESFYEACLFIKILSFALRCSANEHMTLGRFDQYMYPYFQHDLATGVTEEELFETLELFFISMNFDTDLYHGIQQGDNGQSLSLGGFDADGKDMFQQLSKLCMDASLELNLIDPKINLRCGKNTPDWLYDYATKLTKQGLGFPQYCNDDVVVPGLLELGYDLEDAINYSVAACWEFIVPNCAFDVPNIETFNFPLVVSRAIEEHLTDAESFDELMAHVKVAIEQDCDERIANANAIVCPPLPMLSLLIDGCIEQGKDISDFAAKYNNFGCHGAGIANAADALMAVKEVIFDQKSVTKDELLNALHADFEGFEPLRKRLIACPKMGNNEDEVDEIGCRLMEWFSGYLNNKPNNRGGVWRSGTGSAMEYILSARKCPATADGRHAYEPYGSSFSPAITTRLNGPLSVVQSFTKFDMKKIINGGPLTLEIHNTVFRNPEGEKKVARLVKSFIDLGGHQLQLNAINRDTLLDAQAHPEQYPNLIVRVWGWSGYFCELDQVYQDHVISRTEFTV